MDHVRTPGCKGLSLDRHLRWTEPPRWQRFYRFSSVRQRHNLPISADIIIQVAETQYGKFLVNTHYGILTFDPETGHFEVLVKREEKSAAIHRVRRWKESTHYDLRNTSFRKVKPHR